MIRCVILNNDTIYDFFVRVVHCIQSVQDNPVARHFTELWHHTRTIHSVIDVVCRGESPESRDCTTLLESLHWQLILILQQPQSQAQQGDIVIPPTTHSGTPGHLRYDLTVDQPLSGFRIELARNHFTLWD